MAKSMMEAFQENWLKEVALQLIFLCKMVSKWSVLIKIIEGVKRIWILKRLSSMTI